MLLRYARRYRHFALGLAALALASLGVAPFTHGAAAKLVVGGMQDFCVAAAPGESPAGSPSPAGGLAPLCPVCVAFSATDTLSPPVAATVLPAFAQARPPALRPPTTPCVAESSALTPPSHAPPARG